MNTEAIETLIHFTEHNFLIRFPAYDERGYTIPGKLTEAGQLVEDVRAALTALTALTVEVENAEYGKHVAYDEGYAMGKKSRDDEVKALTDRIAELEQDSKRLEWLFRNEGVDGEDLREPFVRIESRYNPHDNRWTWWIESYSSDAYSICTKSWAESFPTFRAAIDDAMKTEEKI